MDQLEISDALQAMESDPFLVTESAYRANTLLWPDNLISFVDCHLAYLKSHPSTNPSHYLSNLRLMLRKS
ncbi:MAG: hypothetical protein WCK69_00480 [Candidatus Saccharibacteria bacterium]